MEAETASQASEPASQASDEEDTPAPDIYFVSAPQAPAPMHTQLLALTLAHRTRLRGRVLRRCSRCVPLPNSPLTPQESQAGTEALLAPWGFHPMWD